MDFRLLTLVAASQTVRWLRRLGGPGLILLGLADNSVIPLPGSMDALTISLLAAGAMQYSRRKFLGALALGRGIRFTIVAYLGARYGRHVLGFFSKYYKPALLVLIGFSVIAGLFGLFQYLRFRHENKNVGTKQKGVPRHEIA